MRISVKCSSAVHVLLMIAVLPASHKITSEFLASSVGSNPVEIRKLLSSLKKAGIIDVTRGPGGAKLKKSPEDITLISAYGSSNKLLIFLPKGHCGEGWLCTPINSSKDAESTAL